MSMQGKLFRKPTIVLLAIVLMLSIFQFTALSNDKALAATDYKIVGYYPSWGAYARNYQVYDMDVSNVTHINYAFADICWNGIHGNPDPTGPNPQTWSCQDEGGVITAPNGTIVLGDPWIDAQKSNPGDTWDEPLKGNLKQLIKLKEANPHLKTIISVGGWSWSNRFSDVAASAATREVFANSAVDFIRKYQFDGVDLDWEYPVSGGLAGNSVRPEDKQNHTLLLQAVRNKLNAAELVDGKQYFLTIASGASPTYAQNNELSNIANVVDWINIMTYDFNGGWQTLSAHNSPLFLDPAAMNAGVPDAAVHNIEVSVQGHLNAGVPAHKIVLGTPFYGRGWSNCATANNGQYMNCNAANIGTWENGIFDFSDLQNNYINKNGYTRHWNNVAKVPYLFNASNGNFISYDDVESIGHKTSFIKANGLGGAMFWEFSGDRNKTLLNKLTSDLQGPVIIDTEAPTIPGNLHSTSKTANTVSLAWNASVDNVGITGYTVSYGSSTVNVTGTSAIISGLSADTSYTFTVKARDAAGNQSSTSNAVTVRTDVASGDTQAPTAPTNLQVTAKSTTSVSLNWAASTDNVGVTGYTVSHGSNQVNVTGTSATISGLSANTSYTFTVTARDAAGNISTGSSIQVTTDGGSTCTAPAWNSGTVYNGGDRVSYNGKVYQADWWTQGDLPDQSGEWGVWKFIENCNGGTSGDTQAPTAPSNLNSTAKTTHSVNLAWHASTDNVGVTGYTVSYGSSTVSVTGTSATISNLSAGTAYTFTVTARDAAGNISAGTSIQVTTDQSSGGSTWAAGISYQVGDEVTYAGATYICRQNHTSIQGWEPSNVPALWLLK